MMTITYPIHPHTCNNSCQCFTFSAVYTM